MPVLSDRVGTFTDSVIRRMTRINNQYDSINLSQGFPDFDPPKQLLDALAETAYKGPHQYAVTFGAQNFREALAKKTSPALHHEVDPNTEKTDRRRRRETEGRKSPAAASVLFIAV